MIMDTSGRYLDCPVASPDLFWEQIKTEKRMFKKTLFPALLLFALFLVSCQDDNTQGISPSPSNPLEGIATLHGNLSSDTVIINVQGGPETHFDDASVKEIMELTGTGDKLYVHVHQVQTKKPALFTAGDISFEEAQGYAQQSVTYLYETVAHFKSQGKVVYLLGISYGAFVTQGLIDRHGPDVADGYLIAVGRMDIDEDTWIPFSQGRFTAYEYETDGSFEIKDLGAGRSAEDRNMARLAAGLGHNRYTTNMDGLTDLSKVIYVYGDRDEQVGPLSEHEIAFLKERGARVLLSENGNHDTAGFEALMVLKGLFGN
jgi:hypothetical protein